MSTTNNKPTYFGLPLGAVIQVEEDGQKVEVIAIPYDQFVTLEDTINTLNSEKEAMQQSMKDMVDAGEDVSMFKEHIWFPDELWEPNDEDIESVSFGFDDPYWTKEDQDVVLQEERMNQ